MSQADPGKESREAQGIPVISSLDGFRALAVAGIVLYHAILFSGAVPRIAGGPLEGIATLLPLGVDVLFIVSGFVVFLPTVVRGGRFGPIGPYAIRRLARLGPAYWLVLLLLFFLLAVAPPHAGVFVPTTPSLGMPNFGDLLGNLAFLQTPLQMADPSFPWGLGVNGPVWTLSVEVAFYAVLPVVAGAYFRRPWWGLAIAALITAAWHLVFGHFAEISSALGVHLDPEREYRLVLASDYQFPAYAFSFAAGMTAAWLFARWRKIADADPRVLRAAGRAQLAALIGVAVSTYFSYRYGIESAPADEFANAPGIGRRAPLAAFAFTASVTILILSTALASPSRQALLAHPVSRWMADISYGVYLIHFVVLAYLLRWLSLPQTGSVSDFFLWAGAALAISIAYGYASALLIERPIRRWAHRFGARAGPRA